MAAAILIRVVLCALQMSSKQTKFHLYAQCLVFWCKQYFASKAYSFPWPLSFAATHRSFRVTVLEKSTGKSIVGSSNRYCVQDISWRYCRDSQEGFQPPCLRYSIWMYNYLGAVWIAQIFSGTWIERGHRGVSLYCCHWGTTLAYMFTVLVDISFGWLRRRCLCSDCSDVGSQVQRLALCLVRVMHIRLV